MATHYVFSVASLDRCLQMGGDAWFATLESAVALEWGVGVIRLGDTAHVVAAGDDTLSPRVVLIAEAETPVSQFPPELLNSVFQRVHRLALSAAKPPVRLPPGWTEFHWDNFVAFFATPRPAVGPQSRRWLVEIRPDGSEDVCFWRLTDPDDPVQLQHYRPNHGLYQRIVSLWPTAVDRAKEALAGAVASTNRSVLEPAIDLEASSFGPVTQYRTYSTWLQSLSPEQKVFVEWDPALAVKLRGPAGSGKTLALVLKVLREVYGARSRGETIRVLFATHSWAVAEQVDSVVQRLDESGGVPELDVYPLLEIARSRVPIDRAAGQGIELLGEDSLSGRLLQLRRIESIVDRMSKGDWLAYRSRVSPALRSRMEAAVDSVGRKALVWDLMTEFSTVLGGERILPGVNGERRYMSLTRRPWMMPLETTTDKQVTFRLYTEYISGLAQDRLLAVDQLVNDFLGYLETFSWNILRETEGYDLVFVDELHLFTEQERLSLHYLTRPASRYPRLFMALDPRQAPSEVYAGVSAGAVARGDSGEADTELGEVKSLEFSGVHRFSPEILNLVRHFHRSYPALDLGPDWELDLDALSSMASHGLVPTVSVHHTLDEECRVLFERVGEIVATMPAAERLAIVVVDTLHLSAYAERLSSVLSGRLKVIQSRDDVDTVLRYSRRSVIVGAAEYLAGLQFDHVIVVGMPQSGLNPGDLAYHRRRALTLLYLAVSRAARHVELHVNDEAGGLPRVLEEALQQEIATRR